MITQVDHELLGRMRQVSLYLAKRRSKATFWLVVKAPVFAAFLWGLSVNSVEQNWGLSAYYLVLLTAYGALIGSDWFALSEAAEDQRSFAKTQADLLSAYRAIGLHLVRGGK